MNDIKKIDIYYAKEISPAWMNDCTRAGIKFEHTHRRVYSMYGLFSDDMQEDLFHTFNTENNPLANNWGQNHLRGLFTHPHTSMSVGDVICFTYPDNTEKYWVVDVIGFSEVTK